MTPLRRYAPFALLVAAQLVLVLVAPSRQAATATGPLSGQLNAGNPGASAGVPGGEAVPGAAGFPSRGGAAGASGAGVGGAVGGANSSGGARTAGGRVTSGKQWCLTGLLEHPPCVPQWAGGDNGGRTWQGVDAKTVTVVMYRYKDNPAVDAVLRETGTYISPSAEKDMFLLVADWINKHIPLYGRTIRPVYYQGNCDIAPVDDACFRSEADSIAATVKPFALFYDDDTNEAAFMDELSRKGVVNWGGWGFSDAFNDGLRPYHYDLCMGGDVQAEMAGTWYCRRLAGRPARFAGDGSLRTRTRKVAVIYPDAPQVTAAAQHLMQVIRGCAGSASVVDGRYSADTSTAAQQATTDTSKYKADGVTTVLWMSDPIAPAYGTKAQAAQAWHPEQVLAGGGLLDYDALAQTYDQSEWAHAFGPSDLMATMPIAEQDAARMWRAEGRSGNPDVNSNLLSMYLLTLTEGIVAAGPTLSPLSYESGLLTAPGYDSWSQWHDPRLVYVRFGRGDYTAVSDIREVYYNPRLTSATNGRSGAYVPLGGGRRYQLGDIPSGEPNLPSGG